MVTSRLTDCGVRNLRRVHQPSDILELLGGALIIIVMVIISRHCSERVST